MKLMRLLEKIQNSVLRTPEIRNRGEWPCCWRASERGTAVVALIRLWDGLRLESHVKSRREKFQIITLSPTEERMSELE